MSSYLTDGVDPSRHDLGPSDTCAPRGCGECYGGRVAGTPATGSAEGHEGSVDTLVPSPVSTAAGALPVASRRQEVGRRPVGAREVVAARVSSLGVSRSPRPGAPLHRGAVEVWACRSRRVEDAQGDGGRTGGVCEDRDGSDVSNVTGTEDSSTVPHLGDYASVLGATGPTLPRPRSSRTPRAVSRPEGFVGAGRVGVPLPRGDHSLIEEDSPGDNGERQPEATRAFWGELSRGDPSGGPM